MSTQTGLFIILLDAFSTNTWLLRSPRTNSHIVIRISYIVYHSLFSFLASLFSSMSPPTGLFIILLDAFSTDIWLLRSPRTNSHIVNRYSYIVYHSLFLFFSLFYSYFLLKPNQTLQNIRPGMNEVLNAY